MTSRAAANTKIFRYLGAILFAVFIIIVMAPVIAFLVGGSGAMTSLSNILPANPMQSPVTLILPIFGVIILMLSMLFQGGVYNEAIGKVHVVTSVRAGNLGTVKFEGLRLKIKSDSPIAVGDYVKAESVTILNFQTNYAQQQTGGSNVVTSRYLVVKKTSPEDATEIPENSGTLLDGDSTSG